MNRPSQTLLEVKHLPLYPEGFGIQGIHAYRGLHWVDLQSEHGLPGKRDVTCFITPTIPVELKTLV